MPFFIVAAAALLAVSFLANQEYDLLRNPFETPTPSPTPTRSALSFLDEAQSYIDQGKVVEAAKVLEMVAEREAENDEVRREIANLYIYGGQYSSALAPAREAVAIDEDNALSQATLAVALTWNQEYDEGYTVAQLAVQMDPTLAQAHARLAEVLASLGS